MPKIEIESQLLVAVKPPVAAMYHLVPLNRLASGRNGRVAQILGHPEDVRRVNELGIRDGIQVEVIRSGMPCIIRTGMQTLCIRGNELLNVLVEPGAEA